MNKKYLKLTVLIAAIFLIQIPARTAPLRPDTYQRLSDEGRLQDYLTMLKKARAKGIDQPEPIMAAPSLRTDVNDAVPDTATVLVLLVDFPDHSWSQGYVAPSPADFDSILFSSGMNPTGSMTEYYKENSYGNFVVTGDVHGIYRMPHEYTYYTNGEGGLGSYPQNSQGLVVDAIVRADSAGIDFSQYDTWGPDGTPDGYVDAVIIVHAGPGGEGTGDENDIHSHKWDLGFFSENRDGVTISVYTVQPEEYEPRHEASPIGIFCHEYGHVLGLPDLYDIDYNPETSFGIGVWSLMASGTYNAEGKIPAQLDAWSKVHIGFVDPIEVGANMTDVEIPQVESEPVIYKLWGNGIYGTEYFLVENRQRVGFDAYLPGGGLLIYHVDDNTDFSNIDVTHYHVALEQADGLMEIEYAASNDGDAYDPYPGDLNVRSFDDLSTPSSRAYDESITKVSVWNISDSDSLMTANLDVTWSRPYFTMDSVSFVDANGNGIIDLGEDIDILFYLKNHWLIAEDVEIDISSKEIPFDFDNTPAYHATAAGDGTVTVNNSEPISFTVPSDIDPSYDSFFVEVSSDGGAFGASFAYERQIGQAQFLIIDDDRGQIYDTVFTRDLYKLRVPADVWSKNTTGSPPGVILSLYNSVIWLTGDTAAEYFTSADIEAMKHFMDNGGNFFLTGQALAAELVEKDSLFFENYLKARRNGLYFSNVYVGVDGNPVFDGISFELLSYHHQYYRTAEQLLPVNGGMAALYYNPFGGYCGITYDGGYKLVFLDFGYEDLDVIEWNNKPRDSLMARVLKFFKGDFTTDIGDEDNNLNLPTAFSLAQNYPNPFNPTTSISYSIPAKAGSSQENTALRIFNILGREVKTLVDEVQRAGDYTVRWDGTNNTGEKVTSGVYFYQLEHGNNKETKKMLLLK